MRAGVIPARESRRALLLAYVGLKLNDRISFFSFAAKPQTLTPAYMHTQDFPALQRAASVIDYAHVESNFTLALTTLGAQLNRRSLIILFTEFTDATSADLMIRAAGRLVKKHRLLFVVIRDEEVEGEERRRPEIGDKHVGTTGSHRDPSNTLKLDGKDSSPG